MGTDLKCPAIVRTAFAVASAVGAGAWLGIPPGCAGALPDGTGRPAAITPTVVCADSRASDQDDMCIWVHPTKPDRSTVIASDKMAGRLLVYDLKGTVIQVIPAGRPGNIDVRYEFPLAGGKVDIVAFNERAGRDRICVCAVDPATRRLRRIDNGTIHTGSNYGGTLFRSPTSGRLYFFVTSGSGVAQYELYDDGKGKVAGRKVRAWNIGLCEGAVGDDETGKVYIAEEDKGVWEVGGEPTDPTPGKLVIPVGRNGLTPDVEGITIYRRPKREGYLLVSSQGSSDFKVYRRTGRHEYLGTFRIRGARSTDGIDVTSAPLAKAFGRGLFACHSDASVRGACPVLLTPWERIARSFKPPLAVDTSAGPRGPKAR